jgi:hypothetical protein
MDCPLLERRRTHPHRRSFDLSSSAKHASGSAGSRAGGNPDDPLFVVREGSRSCFWPAARLAQLRYSPDRVSNGALWPRSPCRTRRRSLPRPVGSGVPRSIAVASAPSGVGRVLEISATISMCAVASWEEPIGRRNGSSRSWPRRGSAAGQGGTHFVGSRKMQGSTPSPESAALRDQRHSGFQYESSSSLAACRSSTM